MPERRDVRDDPRVARTVRGEGSHRRPLPPVWLIGQDHFRALQAGQVPRLRGRCGGQRVRGRGRRCRCVGNVPRARVDERAVDLIGENAAAVPVHDRGQLRHLAGGEDAPDRVARVAEDQQLPPGTERILDRIQVEREEPGPVKHRDLDDLPAEEPRHDQERHVGRGGQDDRRAGAGEALDGDFQRLDHVGNGVDVRGIGVPAVPAQHEFRAGGGQLIGQVVRQVAEVGIGTEPGQGVEDGRRGAEVHLRHGRTEPVRARSRPLEAAAGTERRHGRGVDDFSQASWHVVIFHRPVAGRSHDHLLFGGLLPGNRAARPGDPGREPMVAAR